VLTVLRQIANSGAARFFVVGLALVLSQSSVAAQGGRNEITQTGAASYYQHGGKAANGEQFNAHEFTAAHLTIKFGTRVRVTHLGNGRSVVVRINDRGPFVRGRIIDLSRGAAAVIGLERSGLADVGLIVVQPRYEPTY
jgi:rare lipoprotein A